MSNMFGKKKNELETNLFDKAMSWYQSGDSGKRDAALELFPKDMLEKEIENYKKRDKEERKKLREKELQDVLKKCKKLFPVGTLVWSDDGTDHCVNVIVEEPHIAGTEYRAPYGKYEIGDMDRKTVLAKTIRIGTMSNEPLEGNWCKSYVGLENLLINMTEKKDSPYVRTKPIINLKDLHEKKKAERDAEIMKIKAEIEKRSNELVKYNADLSELEAFNPYEFTKEKIQEIVKQYGG